MSIYKGPNFTGNVTIPQNYHTVVSVQVLLSMLYIYSFIVFLVKLVFHWLTKHPQAWSLMLNAMTAQYLKYVYANDV